MMMYVPFSRYLFKTHPFQSLLFILAIKFYSFIVLTSVYPYELLKIIKPNSSFYYSFFQADAGNTLQALRNARRVYIGLDRVKLYWLFLTQSVLVKVIGPLDRNSILMRIPDHLSGYSLRTTILLNFQQSQLIVNLLMKFDFKIPVYGLDMAQAISCFTSSYVVFFFFFFQTIGTQMAESGYILSQVSALSFIKPMHTLGEVFKKALSMILKFYLTVVRLLSGMIYASKPQIFCMAYCRFGRAAWPKQSFLQAFSRRVLQKVRPFLCLLPILTYLCVYYRTSTNQSVRTLFLSPPAQNRSRKYYYLLTLACWWQRSYESSFGMRVRADISVYPKSLGYSWFYKCSTGRYLVYIEFVLTYLIFFHPFQGLLFSHFSYYSRSSSPKYQFLLTSSNMSLSL